MSRILSSLSLLLLLSSSARAADIAIEDGGVASVQVSQRELTRIAVSGGKLARVWGVEGQFTVQADDETGEAFLRPSEAIASGKAFSFFVRDDRGATYTLVATVADVPAQTVRLRPVRSALSAEATRSGGDTLPYVSAIKALMRSMVNAEDGNPIEDCAAETIGATLPVWKETDIQIERRWRCESLMGEALRLRNISATAMRLDEHEFEALYPDLRAIAITHPVLAPGESTAILLVRRSRR